MKERFMFLHDAVEANGKTIKQNNMEKGHKIPLDTLVEVHIEGSEFDGMRMYVVDHGRDCDGTPLYSLGKKGHRLVDEVGELKFVRMLLNAGMHHNFSDECLTVIKLPQ